MGRLNNNIFVLKIAFYSVRSFGSVEKRSFETQNCFQYYRNTRFETRKKFSCSSTVELSWVEPILLLTIPLQSTRAIELKATHLNAVFDYNGLTYEAKAQLRGTTQWQLVLRHPYYAPQRSYTFTDSTLLLIICQFFYTFLIIFII